MTEIRFYHLQTQSLDQALPQILTKALAGGHRIVVRTASERDTERLNDYLWTFRPDSFLPHGSTKDGYAADQPVFLTAGEDNPNNAGVLILTAGVPANDIAGYTLCCEIFDGRDAGAVSAARERWKSYKADGHDLTYWQQNDKGGWDKK